MNYNIELQSAGLALVLALLLSFVLSKKGTSLQYKIFPFHLAVEILLLCLDIGSCIAIPHMNEHPHINMFFGKGYLISIYLWVSLTTIYSLSCVVNENSTVFRKRIILLISGCIGCAFIVCSLYTVFGNVYFVHNGRQVFSYGGPATAAYIYTALTLIGIVIFLIINKNHMTVNAKIPVWTYISVELISALIQFFVPELLVVGFASALCEFTIFRSLENSRAEEEQGDIIRSFAEVIEGRDENTGEHVKRTTAYVRIIIENLKSQKKYRKLLNKEYSDTLVYAAAMHDIGKIAIPDSVLQKPDLLSEDERRIIETHTLKGAEIIRNSFKKIGGKMFKNMAEDLSLSHHEKWDGSGYPRGVSGDEIPISAQIMAVADVFDAVSQDRCYRKALGLEESFLIIEQGAGTFFSPAIVKAFLDSKDTVLKTFWKFVEEEKK